jgi:hypothetical protein
LGGEGETAAPLEGDVEVGDSCGGTDHGDEVAFGQIVHAGLFGRPLTSQPPPVLPAPAGKDAAIHVGMLEDVERMTPVPNDMSQRREELHPLVDGQVIRALHRDAELAPHGAVRAVGGDGVLRLHLVPLAGRPVEHGGSNPGLVLLEANQLGAEPHGR